MPQTIEQLLRSNIKAKDQPYTSTDIANAYQKEYGKTISQEDLSNATQIRRQIRAELNTPQLQTGNNNLTQVESNKGATDGSASVRNDLANLKDSAQNLDSMFSDNSFVDKALESQAYSQTSQGASDLQAVRDSLRKIGVLSPEDQSQIDAAGLSAANEYVPLIAEAEEQKRLGLPKADIAAGERGGFMNSQFAGVSAILPTQGGTFRGAGGELERIQSVYDNNISNLKNQRLQAAQAAKVAMRQALVTGKRQDATAAMELYEKAKSAHEEMLNLANEKLSVLNNYQNIKNAQVKFSQEKADQTFKRLEQVGMVGGQPSPEDKAQLDSLYGKGFSDKYVSVAQKAKQASDEAQKAEVAKDVLSILQNIPNGRKITINGVEYEGIASADPNTQTFSEEDASGNITYVTIDKNTGEVLKSASGGRIGKGRAPSGGSGGGSTSVVDEAQMVNRDTGEVIGFRQRLKSGETKLIDPTGKELNFSPDMSKIQFVNIASQKLATPESGDDSIF